jgi:hypothetical protein
MYFFGNVRPRKMSWQNNDLISHEAIRVLALPSAAAETTEATQCLLLPTLFATTLSCFLHQHQVARGAVPVLYETRKYFALWWITRSLIWCCVVWYSPKFRRTVVVLSSGCIPFIDSTSTYNVHHLLSLECHLSHYWLSVDVECPPFTVTRMPPFTLLNQRRCRMSSIYCH